MAKPEDYLNQVSQILGVPIRNYKYHYEIQANTLAEAKIVISDLRIKQKQIQQIKKMVGQEIKVTQQAYRATTAKVQPNAFLSLVSGKGKAKSVAADEKRRIAQARDRAIAPYETLKLFLDDMLVRLDKLKMQLEMYIIQNS